MDAKLNPEENIKQYGFWHCFFTRLFKMILDIIHVRSLVFWTATILASRFMSAYLTAGDKTPNSYLGIAVVGAWFLLAVGIGWHRTWEQIWTAASEALKKHTFGKGTQDVGSTAVHGD